MCIIQGVSEAVDITVEDDFLDPWDKKIAHRHGPYSRSLCCWGCLLILVNVSQLTHPPNPYRLRDIEQTFILPLKLGTKNV